METNQANINYFLVFPKIPRTYDRNIGSFHIKVLAKDKILSIIYTYIDLDDKKVEFSPVNLLLNPYLENNGMKIPKNPSEFKSWISENLSWKVYSESFRKYIDNSLIILEEPIIVAEII